MILTLGRDWELLEQLLDPTLRYIIILLLMWPRQSTELLALASSLYSPLMKWNVVSIWRIAFQNFYRVWYNITQQYVNSGSRKIGTFMRFTSVWNLKMYLWNKICTAIWDKFISLMENIEPDPIWFPTRVCDGEKLTFRLGW